MKSALKPYTLPSRTKANRTSQNLSKSMSAPPLKHNENGIQQCILCIASFGMLRHHSRTLPNTKPIKKLHNGYKSLYWVNSLFYLAIPFSLITGLVELESLLGHWILTLLNLQANVLPPIS